MDQEEGSLAERRLEEIGLPSRLCKWLLHTVLTHCTHTLYSHTVLTHCTHIGKWLLRQRHFRRSRCPLTAAMNWLLDSRNQQQVSALIEHSCSPYTHAHHTPYTPDTGGRTDRAYHTDTLLSY
jgi:hypothetical protein